MSVELTRESRRVLKSIYDLYCDRRKSGQAKSAATYFASTGFGKGPDIEGLPDAERELSDVGFIKCDITGGFELRDKAIIFMENFTKDTILKWLEFGSSFIP